MALSVYTKADPATFLSNGGKFTNPLALTFDGTDGGTLVQKLYVRNDDITTTYSGITLSITGDVNSYHFDGSQGFTWKLIAGDTQPIAGQWAAVTPGNSISLGTISGTNTYLPFWLYTETDAHTNVQSFQDVHLTLSATASI